MGGGGWGTDEQEAALLTLKGHIFHVLTNTTTLHSSGKWVGVGRGCATLENLDSSPGNCF